MNRQNLLVCQGFALLVATALLVPAAASAAYPEDADTPTEGWKYGFRSTIDSAQYPLATDKEGASGMSLEAAWNDIDDWPPLASSGGTFSSLGRPDALVAYIEGGVNYWDNGNTQLIKKIYINAAEAMAAPACAARYTPNGDPWLNVLDFPGTPDHNGNGLLDPEDLIVECEDGVDDDGNGYTDDISGWDFYNRQNNPHSQDVTYGHHNGQMLNGEAAINDGGTLGACPLCMVMPIRAGAEALDRTDDLAQAFLFAADSGAASIATLTADLGYSSFMRQAQENLWQRGVLIAHSSNDFDSTDHQGGMYWPHSIPGNGVVKDNEGGVPVVPTCLPGTPLCLPGDTATRTFRQRSGQTSWGTRNMVSVAGTTSTSASTGTLGGILALLTSYGRTAAELGYIDGALTGPEVVQLMIATASDIDPSDFSAVPTAWPTQAGWDLQTGYGRINVRHFQDELLHGNVRPVAWLNAPEWFTLYDPTVTPKVELFGHTEASRSPDHSYDWTLEWAVGAEPTDADFIEISTGTRSAAFDGKLGELDLSAIPASVYAKAFALSTGKELETTENYTVTLRVRVSYEKSPGVVLSGEERRSIFVHHDDDWMAGFPRRIRSGAECAGGFQVAGGTPGYCFSPGGEAQPALVDLAGLGHLQIVFGDTDGYLHAIDPLSGNELPGFPVTTDPSPIIKSGGFPDIEAGFEPMPSNIAVGDLDGDGRLSIVAGTSTGRIYAWDSHGHRRAGFPVLPATGVAPLESPRIPRQFSRMPHQGLFAAPTLSDWDGDGDLEIIEAGYDGHIHLYDGDGSEVTSGNWPIQVRVPDSVPITRPALNNPSDTRTPIRMQDLRISSNPALAQLDDDPELEIVVRSQMSDTMPSDDIEVLSGVGHLIAYDHDGSYLWTAKMDSAAFYYGSAQEFITEGSNSPAAADIDGDGKDEVVSNPVLSTSSYPFKGDGTAFGAAPWTSPQEGVVDPALPIPDVPLGFTTSGAFGSFAGTLTYAQPGSGAASIIGALLTAGSGQPILNKERAWNAQTGEQLPGFPSKLQGLNFLGAPIFADITGDGLAEILDGGDSSALHGYMAGGLQAVLAGFPKFTTGWMLWSPGAADLDSDGTTEIVANTREGVTMVWHTPGLAASNSEWWRYGHDEWNTRRYGTDTRPPGILRDPVLDTAAHGIAFTAPGDDWYAGSVAAYVVRYDGGEQSLAAAAAAGANETLAIPAAVSRGTVHAVDDAGNLGRGLAFDFVLGTVGGLQPVAGSRLLFVQDSAKPAWRVVWQVKDALLEAPSGDDAPTVAGASVTISNPDSGESATIELPAAGWAASGDGRYRYKSDDGSTRIAASIKSGRMKVKARGGSIAFTLDEPSQGSLAVVLSSGERGYCTLFGGEIDSDEPGKFSAKRAGAPDPCPAGP
ncbi:MAG TPA: hypothetical protein VN634_15975 [Candidatus Limnocylindrales bacterium]|nr:hypothetical protein [Candidatus Limnocylindrales bacterium]